LTFEIYNLTFENEISSMLLELLEITRVTFCETYCTARWLLKANDPTIKDIG